MTDYYPLIARAVSGLDKNTTEARRALYERARAALQTQLRSVTPALSEGEVTRERLSLEEAIRRVETDAVRRTPVEARKSEMPASSFDGDNEMRSAESGAPESSETFTSSRREEKRAPADRPSLTDQGLKGFRDGLAEDADADEKPQPPKSSKSSYDPFAGFPLPRDQGRVEPGFGPQELLHPPRELPSPKPAEPRGAGKGRTGPMQPRPQQEDFGQVPTDPPRRPGFEFTARKIVILVMVAILAVAAVFAYRERASIATLYQTLRGSAPQTAKDQTPTRPKISDRIGGDNQPASSAPQPSGPAVAQVAQRAVLYEQQPNSEERKQYVGSVIWRTESGSPGPGQPPDVAIRADVEIPERHMRMSFTLRRNTDQTLPASHTIEILFAAPPDFPGGGIADVPGVLMEEADQNRGAGLAGMRVKVIEGFFLIGLSGVDFEARRNIQLLKERPWAHIPIFYKNNQRALLALEKGVPGDRVFAEAFAAWQQ